MRYRLRLLAVAILLWFVAPTNAADNGLQIYVIDVGQGDSTLIVGPEDGNKRATLLIDAGDNRTTNGANLVRDILKKTNVNHLDYVVLSHYDADHMGGFVQVGNGSDSLLWKRTGSLKNPRCTPTNFFPKKVIVDIGRPIKSSKSRTEWRACIPQITNKDDKVRHIKISESEDLGYILDLGKGYEAKIVSGRGYIISNPNKVENADSPNEMSIAVLVSGPHDFDFLVTGDLIGVRTKNKENAKLEDALADAIKKETDLEILRAGHHGARNATSRTFIAKLKPEVALISVGAKKQGNTYRHPHCKTLENLKPVGLVIQTGTGNHDCLGKPPIEPVVVNGAVLIEVKGEKYTIKSLPNTSSLGLKTKEFSKSCTVSSGCSN